MSINKNIYAIKHSLRQYYLGEMYFCASAISEFNQMMSKFIIQLLFICTILLCVCVCTCVCVVYVLQSTKVFMLYFM